MVSLDIQGLSEEGVQSFIHRSVSKTGARIASVDLVIKVSPGICMHQRPLTHVKAMDEWING